MKKVKTQNRSTRSSALARIKPSPSKSGSGSESTGTPTGALIQEIENSLYGRQDQLFQDLNLSLLAQLFYEAQSGKLGTLIDLYNKIRSSETRVQSGINNRFLSTFSSKINIAPADVENDEAVKYAEFIKYNFDQIDTSKFIQQIVDGFLNGVELIEKVYKKESEGEYSGRFVISQTHSVDQHRLMMNMYDVGSMNYGRLYLSDKRSGFHDMPIADLPAYKIVLSTQKDQAGFYDTNAIMRSVARWYVVKNFVMITALKLLERFGLPVPIIKVDEQEYKKNKQMVADFLKSYLGNRFGVLFDTMELEKHEVNLNNVLPLVEYLIKLANSEMIMAIIGSNLTTEVSGGSYNATEVHKTELDEIKESDMVRIESIINKQFIIPLIRINYPKAPAGLMPKANLYQEKPISRKDRANEVSAILKSAKLSTEWIAEYLDIPDFSNDEIAKDKNVIGGLKENFNAGYNFD